MNVAFVFSTSGHRAGCVAAGCFPDPFAALAGNLPAHAIAL